MILVEYNGVAVGGTPYYSKAYDSESVGVSDIPKSAAGKTVTFAGKSYLFIFRRLGQSELKSGKMLAILFPTLAKIPYIITVDGTSQPEILTDDFFFKNEFYFHH